MQIYKFAFGLAFTTAALIAVVLLAVSGNVDVAIVVAVAAGLVGMYVLRHHARTRLVDGERPPSVGDPSEPESRRQERHPTEEPYRDDEGTVLPASRALVPALDILRERARWTW